MSPRDKKLKEYLEKAREILPGIDSYSAAFSLFSGDEPTSGKITLSNQSNAIKANFNYSENKCLIHYTSMDSMFSILNSQALRMYNCLNLNDAKEIEYANSQFNIELSPEETKNFKQNNFVTSFCEYDMILQNDDFNLWRLYGNQGHGVGLVFEVENMNDSWDEVFIGKVFYDMNDSIIRKFSAFVEFHKEFNRVHKLFENTPSILSAIALHLKDDIWKTENEVRLFAHCPFDEYDLQREYFEGQNHYLSGTMEHAINKSGKVVSYVNLPLNQEKVFREFKKHISDELAKDYLSSFPHLKLKRIVLGYNVSSEVGFDIEKILFWLKKNKEFNDVQLEYSLLKKRFE